MVVEEATICAVWLPTATAGGTPRKIRSGVIRNPPPIPNSPDTKPTAAPRIRISQDIHRHLGDRQIDLHASPLPWAESGPGLDSLGCARMQR